MYELLLYLTWAMIVGVVLGASIKEKTKPRTKQKEKPSPTKTKKKVSRKSIRTHRNKFTDCDLNINHQKKLERRLEAIKNNRVSNLTTKARGLAECYMTIHGHKPSTTTITARLINGWTYEEIICTKVDNRRGRYRNR